MCVRSAFVRGKERVSLLGKLLEGQQDTSINASHGKLALEVLRWHRVYQTNQSFPACQAPGPAEVNIRRYLLPKPVVLSTCILPERGEL